MPGKKIIPVRIRPYIKLDGSPDRRFAISRYLRNDGRKKANMHFPKGVRSIPELYRKTSPEKPAKKISRAPVRPPSRREKKKPAKRTQQKPAKRITGRPVQKHVPSKISSTSRGKRASGGKSPKPVRKRVAKTSKIPEFHKDQPARKVKKPGAPWLKKDGTPDKRLSISKYLTKDGKLKKGKKLPPGVKTIPELWDYLNAKSHKPEEGTEGLICTQHTAVIWDFWTFIESEFDRFKEVYMGGKILKTYDDMLLYIDDYLNGIILENQGDREETQSQDVEIPYQICRNSLYEYLYF